MFSFRISPFRMDPFHEFNTQCTVKFKGKRRVKQPEMDSGSCYVSSFYSFNGVNGKKITLFLSGFNVTSHVNHFFFFFSE